MRFIEITDIGSFTSSVSTMPFKLLPYGGRYFIFIYMKIYKLLIPRRMKLTLS